jgi:hypothetical protein
MSATPHAFGRGPCDSSAPQSGPQSLLRPPPRLISARALPAWGVATSWPIAPAWRRRWCAQVLVKARPWVVRAGDRLWITATTPSRSIVVAAGRLAPIPAPSVGARGPGCVTSTGLSRLLPPESGCHGMGARRLGECPIRTLASAQGAFGGASFVATHAALC